MDGRVEASWNVMVHAQKPDFVFRAKRTSPFKSAEGVPVQSTTGSRGVRISSIMLDAPRSEVVWRVLATHSILQFPLHFPSRASPCGHHISTGVYNQRTTSRSTPSAVVAQLDAIVCTVFAQCLTNGKQIDSSCSYTGIPRYTRSHFTRFRYNAI